MYVPLTRVTAWARGRYSLRVCRLCRLSNPRLCFYFLTIMVNNINNFGVINFYESNSANTHSETKQVEDITPLSSSDSDIPDSIIFTKKAKKEGQIPTIIQAFKSVLANRRDKSRALAQEVKVWQKDEYIDANYNAQVMYDEIAKIMPLPFGYEAFKQHYNNTRF